MATRADYQTFSSESIGRVALGVPYLERREDLDPLGLRKETSSLWERALASPVEPKKDLEAQLLIESPPEVQVEAEKVETTRMGWGAWIWSLITRFFSLFCCCCGSQAEAIDPIVIPERPKMPELGGVYQKTFPISEFVQDVDGTAVLTIKTRNAEKDKLKRQLEQDERSLEYNQIDLVYRIKEICKLTKSPEWHWQGWIAEGVSFDKLPISVEEKQNKKLQEHYEEAVRDFQSSAIIKKRKIALPGQIERLPSYELNLPLLEDLSAAISRHTLTFPYELTVEGTKCDISFWWGAERLVTAVARWGGQDRIAEEETPPLDAREVATIGQVILARLLTPTPTLLPLEQRTLIAEQGYTLETEEGSHHVAMHPAENTRGFIGRHSPVESRRIVILKNADQEEVKRYEVRETFDVIQVGPFSELREVQVQCQIQELSIPSREE